MIRRLITRFLSDCRDLWVLIRHGQPADDALLAWRLAADLAKIQPQPIDWDEWERERFSKDPSAFWFDPARYDGTPYAWAERAGAQRLVSDFVIQKQQQQALMYSQLAAAQSASSQNAYANYRGNFITPGFAGVPSLEDVLYARPGGIIRLI